MRMLMLTGGLLTLAGCANFGMPDPDPSQAWIDLDARQQDTTLQALKVDSSVTDDKRYFEVQPGSHELKVRYQFPVAATNIGPDAEPLWRDCQMNREIQGLQCRPALSVAGWQHWFSAMGQTL
jgi:hypothetical protein